MSTGVIYIAMGDEFVAEARVSARSLRSSMPDVPVCIITDEEMDLPEFDEELVVDDPHYSFEDKVENMALSPYDKTVYLDTDVYVEDDISDLFELVDVFHIAVAHNGAGRNDRRETYTIEGVPDSFPEYNTGVVAFDTDEMAEFTPDWKDAHRADHPHDQPSFRYALYHSDLRIATLPPEFNCLFREPGNVVGRVKLFHGRLKDINSPGAGRYYDVQTAIEQINGIETNRVFVPKATGGFNVYSADSIAKRARLSVVQYGVRGTVKRAIEKIT